MSLLNRIKKARLPRILAVYLGASWVVVEAADLLQEALSLPTWVVPVTLILLLAGLVVVAATAWVQGSPATDQREATGEVPSDWELDLRDMGRSLRKGRLPHLTWSRVLLGGVVAFLAMFGLAALLDPDIQRPSLVPDELSANTAAPGLAVLPFRVTGEELVTWREGLVDLLSRNLDGLGGIRAIDSRTVLARWREAVDGEPDLAAALAVAQRTGARWALLGTAVDVGSAVRVSVDAYDVATGSRLASASAENSPDSLLSIVDELSVAVARALLEQENPDHTALRLSSITTESPEALRAFLEGEAAYRQSSFEPALEAFERAVALDPQFALAHFRIGSARGWLIVGSPAEAREHAYQHRDRLPAREELLVEAEYRARNGALPSGVALLQQGVKRYPDDPELWYQLGDVYIHWGPQLMMDVVDAKRALERAVELDPGFAPYRIHLVDLALMQGDSAAAARQLEAQRALTAPGARQVQSHQTQFDYLYGSPEDRERVLSSLPDMDRTLRTRLRLPYTIDGEKAGQYLELANHVCELDLASAAANGADIYMCLNTLMAGGQPERARHWSDEMKRRGVMGPAALADLAMRQTGLDPNAPQAPPISVSLMSDTGDAGQAEFFVLGVLAVEQARSAVVDSILDELRGWHDELATQDSLRARIVRGLIEGVEGYRSLARNDERAALRSLDRAASLLAGSTGPEAAMRTVVVWPLAELYASSGQLAKALGHYESLRSSHYAAPALLRRAEIHDRMGEAERADELRRHFLSLWANAPADHHMVRRARQGLPAG